MSKGLLIKIYRRLLKEFGPQGWWPGDGPFEVMIGAILTQNTNWGNVERAIKNLKMAKALSPSALHKISEGELAELIRPAGYFNIKAGRLKAFIEFFITRYSKSVSRMKNVDTAVLRHELLGVNGIGPETADSILLYALQKPVFVIDAYTKRALSRHGIIDEKASYHKFQELFHSSLTPDVKVFNEYHALLVRLGKEFCRPRPRCDICLLSDMLPEPLYDDIAAARR